MMEGLGGGAIDAGANDRNVNLKKYFTSPVNGSKVIFFA